MEEEEAEGIQEEGVSHLRQDVQRQEPGLRERLENWQLGIAAKHFQWMGRAWVEE